LEKFRSGELTLEAEKGWGQLLVVDNDQLRDLDEVSPCQTVPPLTQKLGFDVAKIYYHLLRSGKMKNSTSGFRIN
jgi:hypothetical protein